jgi:hypothetical protein
MPRVKPSSRSAGAFAIVCKPATLPRILYRDEDVFRKVLHSKTLPSECRSRQLLLRQRQCLQAVGLGDLVSLHILNLPQL